MIRDPAWGEPSKRITRMVYDRGPVGFLSLQVCKAMQRVCYPAAVIDDLSYRRGVMTFQHELHGRFPSSCGISGDGFWSTLSDCVLVISEKFSCEIKELERGVYVLPYFDFAENQNQLDLAFKEYLPTVWAAHLNAQKNKQISDELRSRLVA